MSSPSTSTTVRTALNFPYGWWERTGANRPHPHVAARLREGVLGELRTVRDGRFNGPPVKAAAVRSAPNARAAIDSATTFRRVDAEWRPRLDALRNKVEAFEAQVAQAQTLRRALMAYQVERLATAAAAPREGGGKGGVPHAGATLAEAVAVRRRECY